jgi:hypothetical protein
VVRDELTFGQDLVYLCLRDALDEEEVLLGRESDAFDSVVSGFGELLAVGARDAKVLKKQTKKEQKRSSSQLHRLSMARDTAVATHL